MAVSKATLVAAVLCLILAPELHVHADEGANTKQPLLTQYCVGKCAYRCSVDPRLDKCIKACHTCCKTCQCVPSGTSGHLEECPCYARLRTRKGRPKCP